MDGRWRIGGTDFSPDKVSANWRLAAVGDFNRDNAADVIWQDEESGLLVGWFLEGTRLLRAVLLNPAQPESPNWRVVGPR
jgi:hypothetical protein